jgi:hypothetical protein
MQQLAPQQRNGNQITIIAAPTSRRFVFATRIEASNRYLVASTYQPLLDSARRLLDHGYDPALTLVMKHEGSDTEAPRSTIGAAARLTVKESAAGRGPRFVPWNVFRPCPVASPIAPQRAVATLDAVINKFGAPKSIKPIFLFAPDRAAVVARTVMSIITTAAAPEDLRNQVLQLLREEFEDERCQAVAERTLVDA